MNDVQTTRGAAELRLAGGHARARLCSEFELNGRLRITGLLAPESAQAIHDCLADQKKWNLTYNQSGTHVDLDSQQVASWGREQREALNERIYAQARNGFQYHYHAIPIYDIYHGNLLPGHFLNQVFRFLNSPAFLELARTVCADPSISFADAQATCFEPGHFLTRHDDDVAGKNRRVAYVLGLTRRWRSDWGGALQFLGPDGHVERAFFPEFNTLNLFRVPAAHSVAIVAPFAGEKRYSITGWLRAGPDPLAKDQK